MQPATLDVLASDALGPRRTPRGFLGARIGPLSGTHIPVGATRRTRDCGVAIQANVEAYLKCLIVKEAVGLNRSRFLLGDFCEYLGTTMIGSTSYSHPGGLPHGRPDRADRVDRSCHRPSSSGPITTTPTPTPSASNREPDARSRRMIRYEHQYGDMDFGRFWAATSRSTSGCHVPTSSHRSSPRVSDTLRCSTSIGSMRTGPRSASPRVGCRRIEHAFHLGRSHWRLDQ